jgi:hypothetical protein
VKVWSWAHVAEGVVLLGERDDRLRGTCVRRTEAEEWRALVEPGGGAAEQTRGGEPAVTTAARRAQRSGCEASNAQARAVSRHPRAEGRLDRVHSLVRVPVVAVSRPALHSGPEGPALPGIEARGGGEGVKDDQHAHVRDECTYPPFRLKVGNGSSVSMHNRYEAPVRGPREGFE